MPKFGVKGKAGAVMQKLWAEGAKLVQDKTVIGEAREGPPLTVQWLSVDWLPGKSPGSVQGRKEPVAKKFWGVTSNNKRVDVSEIVNRVIQLKKKKEKEEKKERRRLVLEEVEREAKVVPPFSWEPTSPAYDSKTYGEDYTVEYREDKRIKDMPSW
uniref:Uncharacterized protein n=1 Tax=Chromera velia CCMP2878 TaxID=1169474 RepID=A0A0G4FWM5_9ALVE|eukprot:Cvel_19148.t1-p1 / transcript=Cvel_19148.t1 / gene=Cvel_19148 / organism=Chromera_velia_CCMP2878 / gene_product=hypothetical protein / transcript_product=hypothetical protein / location=Cvel_scaffold1629:31565-32029(-) / protein_length=155 / sequence_SO=supercontig / SO=protein_coding / is_pseudo=false